ncbi:hypothetical protein [Kribbella kalugense]|uniref:Tetratricopeptide repeat protein n=1 Tax=Kribbella kalugense TaxID=2512221 RepID=A0A4R7ZUF8_9ACTN|nr:hypothetical protein [Kribbella kalugense]TDW21659.1 hypothetical protein EV650_0488 [Kribbella kalugense]
MSQLAAIDVVTAATHLMRAGQWTAATALLTATNAEDPAERATLTLALAEVAVDQDFAQRTNHGSAALEAVLDDSWDLEFLKFRKDYSTALFGGAAGDLSERALALIAQAPDDARRGMANFYAGVMADNLYTKPAQAFAHYEEALALGEKSQDELLISLALRHLGDHAHTAGDLVLARTHWERSTELRQKVGHLLGALAQQSLLAMLLRDEGDIAGSRALATEVNRWARQVDLEFIVRGTAELMGSPNAAGTPAP